MDTKNNLMIRVTNDNLQAELMLVNNQLENIRYTKEDIVNCLKKHNITYGIKHDVIEKLLSMSDASMLPIIIAEGTDRIDGIDAQLNIIEYTPAEIDEEKEWNFRDVMDIPTVKKHAKLAIVEKETKGRDGTNVFGKPIKARHGKPIRVRAGKNVIYDENSLSFYAEKEGQASFTDRQIQVQDVYVVNETLSMKIGNIQFPGTVMIHGDVPTGFTIEADGDIKVFGIVEGATLKAKGSIYIGEGIAGIQQGSIEADVDVHARYINQGNVKAGENITVDHSILHSSCEAGGDIHCRVGNIIGGKIFAQNKITAKDFGNRMHTETIVGIMTSQSDQSEIEAKEIAQLKENIRKIETLIKNMEQNKSNLSGQDRVLLLRLKKSLQSSSAQLKEIESVQASHQVKQKQQIITNGTIHPNVVVLFGKYETAIQKEVNFMTLTIERNEIKYVPRV